MTFAPRPRTGRQHSRLIRIFALAFPIVIGVSAIAPGLGTAAGAKPVASAADIALIASAALDASSEMAASENSKQNQASRLTDLAGALIKAGYPEAARAAVLAAAALFEQPNNGIGSLWRGLVVDDLVRLGDSRSARKLVDVQLPPLDKSMVFGKFGVALAETGDIDGAKSAFAEVQGLPTTSSPTGSVISKGVLDIGSALVAVNAIDPVERFSTSLPDGLPKVTLLARIAVSLCMPSAKGPKDLGRGTDFARRAEESARAAISVAPRPYEKSGLAAAAGEAVAECKGTAEAKSFVTSAVAPASPTDALLGVVDRLVADGSPRPARTLVPTDDKMAAEDWLGVAKRLRTLGDVPSAIAAARTAFRMGSEEGVPTPGSTKWDRLAFLSQVFGVLVQLGAYDEAIAAMPPYDSGNQLQFYSQIVTDAIKKQDQAAIERLVPISIRVFTSAASSKDARGANFLFDLSRTLALAGYQKEANVVADSWHHADTPIPGSHNQGRAIELQAITGDFDGAMARVGDLGPMTDKPDPTMALVAAAMSFDGRTTKPTQEEAVNALQRASAAMPALVPSVRATTLSRIADDMANMEKLPEAVRAESDLEVDPDHLLMRVRDQAIAAISRAQAKSGDLRRAFETARRITQPADRFSALVGIVKAATGS